MTDDVALDEELSQSPAFRGLAVPSRGLLGLEARCRFEPELLGKVRVQIVHPANARQRSLQASAEPVLHAHAAEGFEVIEVARDYDELVDSSDGGDLGIAIRGRNAPPEQPGAFGAHPFGRSAIEWQHFQPAVDEAVSIVFELATTR